MGRIIAYLLAAVVVVAFASSFFLTLFVVQPIDAVPEGRTLIVSRSENMEFIDSADAICAREMVNVSHFCRTGALADVINTRQIYARLPYSEWLYKISTDGKSYEKTGHRSSNHDDPIRQ